MKFTATELPGVVVVDPQRRQDERGWFARTFCADEFAEHGLPARWAQANASFSVESGTLRGLHWQVAPHAENKLVTCVRGVVFDVIVDVRPDSPSFRRWTSVTLDPDGGRAVLVPEGCAHGFLTLADASEVRYLVSAPYAPDAERGARWDDPAFGIRWPQAPRVVSARDLAHPPFGAGA